MLCACWPRRGRNIGNKANHQERFMKPSEEQRLGNTIITAQERVRLWMCRNGTAAQWHLTRAATVVGKPKLLERIAPHLTGESAQKYLAALPNLLEETKLLDVTCGDMWNRRRSDYMAERDRLVTMLLRYDFTLRSYEKLARKPSLALVAAGREDNPHNETATRMLEEDFTRAEREIHESLHAIDQARTELVAGHADLVVKLVQKNKSAEPVEEVTAYAQHGLEKAAENFDVRQGHRFGTYAQWWIKMAIKEKKTWEK
jgi:hypothetical protein